MEPVLDPAPLEQLRALQRPGRPDLIARLIEMFRDDAPKKRDEIGRSLETEDAETLHRAAHTLKSSAANLGARELSVRAAEIEAAAREGRFTDARALAEALAPMVDRAMEALAGREG